MVVLLESMESYVAPDEAITYRLQEHGWEEGKLIVFDDTFRHEAWNPSHEKTRIVLMFDIYVDVDEEHRNPVFMDLSKKRGYALFDVV